MRLLILISIAVGLAAVFWQDEVSRSFWSNVKDPQGNVRVASLGNLPVLPSRALSGVPQQGRRATGPTIDQSPLRQSQKLEAISILKARAEDFESIVSRPLFDPTRRPPRAVKPKVAAKPIKTAPRPPNLPFVLVGTIAAESGQATALLRRAKQKKVVRARVGDTVSNWKVLAITASTIEFGHRNWKRELRLYR